MSRTSGDGSFRGWKSGDRERQSPAVVAWAGVVIRKGGGRCHGRDIGGVYTRYGSNARMGALQSVLVEGGL